MSVFLFNSLHLFCVFSITLNQSDSKIPCFSKNVLDFGKNPKLNFINVKLHGII